jgi:carbon storage regulator
MLVIRRRAGESLLIGDDVEIQILEVATSQVKIGIRAPKRVVVLRKEIHLTEQQNRDASHDQSIDAVDSFLRTLKKRALDPMSHL